jgi:sodium--glutamate symport carrier gltS
MPGSGAPFDLRRAANALALSLVICAVSFGLSKFFRIEPMFILVVTALALLVANFAKPVLRHVSQDFELGTLFMYLFFVCIGAGANLADVVGPALPIQLFIMVMVLVHQVVIVLAGRQLRQDLAEVKIASNAGILGPAPAAALAASKGWQPLVAPGILVGMFGYAIATFIGVSLAALFRLWS